MEPIRELELQKIQAAAKDYREQGYEVIVHPMQEQLPEFLLGFHPDLLVKKEEEKIIIEVKSRQSLLHNPQIREMARVLQSAPGWKFELMIVGIEDDMQPTKDTRPFTESDILYGIEQSRNLLNAHLPEPALLYAWSSAEAALRIIAEKEGIAVKPPTPLNLIKTLTTEGILSKEVYDTLIEIMKIRNAVAHGSKIIQESANILGKLFNAIDTILHIEPIIS